MELADPESASTAYLILRHLYDGDIIDWPIPDHHPRRDVFAELEAQGLIARWDRMWPLSDRYRLTERGIAAIEAVYRPAGAELVWDDLQRRQLSPVDRRAHLQSQQLDPLLWPVLHDPSTHWSDEGSGGGRYSAYVWEDQRPARRRRTDRRKKAKGVGGTGGGGRVHRHHEDDVYVDPRPVLVVDLDRQAQDEGLVAPEQPDVDVS